MPKVPSSTSAPRAPGATLMTGGQRADSHVPVHAGPSRGSIGTGGEDLGMISGRAHVAAERGRQASDYARTVMSTPDVTRNAPGPVERAPRPQPSPERHFGHKSYVHPSFTGFMGDD